MKKWQIVIITVMGIVICLMSILLFIYLAKIVRHVDFIAVLHFIVPFIGMGVGIWMLMVARYNR
ncbi:MAG: hypothetical protein Q4C46_11270 [Bacillota bacterium]|nr:hypothetical protein [Bacillota bacterium]